MIVIFTTNSHYYQMSNNPLNAKLNPIYHFLALLRTRHIFHVSRIRAKNNIMFVTVNNCSDILQGDQKVSEHLIITMINTWQIRLLGSRPPGPGGH
jgi:hypothetical protein